MGWTSMPTRFKSGDSEEIKRFLVNLWDRDSKFQTVDYSKRGNTVYLAIEQLETGEVFAVVTLISFDDGEFYWKEISEDMGPFRSECPQRLLKLLTPTDNKYAKEWRKRCWRFHEKGGA